jgi:hypothetical protein
MKHFAPITFLAAALSAFAAPQGIPILSTYGELWDLCVAGGPNSVRDLLHSLLFSDNILQYVGVIYANGALKTYNYGQCYPYELPGNILAKMAVFCKSVTCENNP